MRAVVSVHLSVAIVVVAVTHLFVLSRAKAGKLFPSKTRSPITVSTPLACCVSGFVADNLLGLTVTIASEINIHVLGGRRVSPLPCRGLVPLGGNP